jgi:hypothetical protein
MPFRQADRIGDNYADTGGLPYGAMGSSRRFGCALAPVGGIVALTAPSFAGARVVTRLPCSGAVDFAEGVPAGGSICELEPSPAVEGLAGGSAVLALEYVVEAARLARAG